MEPFFDASKSMVELMPYLGGKKYPDLLALTRKYYTAGNEQKISDSGNIGGNDDTHLANKTPDSNVNISADALEEKK